MTDDLDPRETRTHDERHVAHIQALQHVFVEAKLHTAHYVKAFADFDVESLTSPEALAKLPVLRKSDLIPAQEETPPFGGIASQRADTMVRLFLSPGPIAEPQTGDDQWRFSRALRAAGFKKGDICHNCFSYHLTPAGFMFDSAARALGCAVFPGGVGNTETQVQAMHRFGAIGFCRNARFPEDHHGERPRNSARPLPQSSAPASAAGRCFPTYANGTRPADSPACRTTAPPMSA